MSNTIKLLASMVLVATQATATVQPNVAASTGVPSPAEGNSKIIIQFQPAAVNPVVVSAKPLPNFETEVLAPLRASQAAEAAAKAEAARQAQLAAQRAKFVVVTAAASPHAGAPATPENWLKLRYCESGNNYANKRNPSYRGAYQFAFSTWGNYGGFYDPADAPPEVQDAKAQATFNSSGWRPWGCAYSLGFI